jgi:predicted Ser/Thr protein kinase
MNKAELKANEYFDCVNCHIYANTREDLKEDVTEAYIAGYEARNGEVKSLKEKVHWWKKEVNVAHKAREDEFEKLVIETKALKRKLDEAKEIIGKFLNAKSIEETCVAESEAEKFLKEE